MKIKIAEKAGFCFGVKRAVDIAIKESQARQHVYSYGQLIHNDQVTEKLTSNGLIEVKNLEDVQETVIIRSHGVGSDIYETSNAMGLEVIDCTCPYVLKVHKIVDKFYKDGYKIIIIGNPMHPEIIGINGWCNNQGIIIRNEHSIPELPSGKYCVVAQTTLKLETFNNVVESLSYLTPVVHNTICSATEERQNAAVKLASEVDCMVVVGGYHSSNTRKLYELCKNICENTVHIEKKDDLIMTKLNNCGIIGITAGASTPSWIIEEVCEYLERYVVPE